jgi:hypothetical protein
VLGDQRDSLARTRFVGGNAHMLRLLNRFRDELGVTAPRRRSKPRPRHVRSCSRTPPRFASARRS